MDVDHKVEITDKEKDLLRKKLQEMVELEKQEEILKNKKKEIEQNLNQFRPELSDTLVSEGRSRVKSKQHKLLVSRVPKSQHRRPTLETTYQAIQNVLGKDQMENVKKAVKENREKMKKQCQEGTLKVIPTKALRKVRKDKKPDDEKANSRKRKAESKKLKYTKKQNK